uniref:Uncharacterized protein n=1 Tax=viral metagenome TaxID=1070528 RepID=A0A6C0IPD3_9ZZZZ
MTPQMERLHRPKEEELVILKLLPGQKLGWVQT